MVEKTRYSNSFVDAFGYISKTLPDHVPEKIKQLLLHIVRFRLTTEKILKTVVFPDMTDEAIKSQIRRLKNQGVLNKASFQNGKYCYLTKNAMRLYFQHLDSRSFGPFGPQAIITHYATLKFFCENPQNIKLLDVEFREIFPSLELKGVTCKDYYIRRDGSKRRIGIIVVDQSANARNIAKKISSKVIGRRITHETWYDLFKKGILEISVITYAKSKAESLSKIFIDEDLPIAPQVAYYEELYPLVERKALR
jgi:hypothetical protein